ncbi:MAG TPA: methylglutaconyl-CoA hydratase [Bacteroidetes bacterium]|nr:methylglutaconyl-CoA hydratase [Bacteroidota bacterium]
MENIVLYELSNRVAYITLNREDRRNALNPEMINALSAALTKAGNDSSVKVIVIRANGNVFCSGADLAHLQKLQSNSFEENLSDSLLLAELFKTIYLHPKIIIAQVEGAAIAGGCGLATVCDFTFATPDSRFGYTEARIGFVPAIVMFFLIRKIGEAKAKQFLYTGKLTDAQTAFDSGLINKIYSAESIRQSVQEFAEGICRDSSAQSLTMTKLMIANVQSLSLEDAMNYAARMNANARETDDCRKGISAFLNKETIQW